LVRKSPETKALIAKGKQEVTIAKLKKMLEEPDLKELAQQKLAQKQNFDFVKVMESQDIKGLDAKMSEMLEEMEKELADGRPFLVGADYTLADVVGTAYCARVHMVRGETLFGRNVVAYWHRMKDRHLFEKRTFAAFGKMH